jgi:uncharacterized protein
MGIATKFLFGLPAKIAVALIELYQLLLSPDHSWLKARFPHGYCRFYPSCSQYSKQSIQRFGLLKGLWLSVKRLSHCHPWAEPKLDPVPHL